MASPVIGSVGGSLVGAPVVSIPGGKAGAAKALGIQAGGAVNLVSKQKGEKFVSTSYGPPWGGIQGTGVTAGGTNLKNAPHKYIVAVDPKEIPLGTKVYIQPNPFNYDGPFLADDTGGAIKGKRIDFYDWRGRKEQNAWGRRDVLVSAGPATDLPGAKVKDATDNFGVFRDLAQKFLALFYPSTWKRIGLVVLGIGLLIFGVNALMKSSFGVGIPKPKLPLST